MLTAFKQDEGCAHTAERHYTFVTDEPQGADLGPTPPMRTHSGTMSKAA
jgi:hypothetical protein